MSLSNPLPSVYTRTAPGPAPNGLGQGLFASTSINPGEDALSIDTPFVAVLETQRLTDTCHGCFGQRQLDGTLQSELRACTGCQTVKYCDKTCQANDWKFAHSLECNIFAQLAPKVLPINARTILRMVLRSTRRKYTAAELDLLVQLETHVKDMRAQNASQWDRIALSSKAVKAYSGTAMNEDAISAFGAKLDVNSFNMTTALYDRIGLYMHPYAALINHSCDYNAVVGFDGPRLTVKALRAIAKDEQVFISYVDATSSVDRRRAELRERYFFDCACGRCVAEENARATGSAAPLLQEQVQKAYMLMEMAAAPGVDPLEVVDSVRAGMRMLLSSSSQEEEEADSTWPVTRQPLVSLRDELIAALLSAGRFRDAFVQAAVRVVRVDPGVYGCRGHPIRQLHAWTLAKLGIHLSQGIEVVEGTEAEGGLLEKAGVELGLIIWSVLSEMVRDEAESCAVRSFQRMVRAAFAEVQREFGAQGLDPRAMGDAIRGEWEKVEAMVSAALEQERN